MRERIANPIALGALAAALAVLGCPDAPILTDTFDARGPGDVDMLWVIDNSESMADAQLQLTENFHAFVRALPESSTTQMGITTTQAWPCAADEHPQCDDEVGTAGRLRRHGSAPALLDPSVEADQALFQQLAHVGIHGSGFERALQAALMAACEARALPDVSDFVGATDDLREDFPHGCSGEWWDPGHEYYDACHCLPREVETPTGPTMLHGANAGLLRGDNPLHVVVLADEGDDTCSLEALGDGACDDLDGDEQCDCRLAEMLRLLRDVVGDVRISVIGPGQGPATPEQQYLCNPMGSTKCAMDFYFGAVGRTEGLFAPLLEPGDLGADCLPAELAPALADLVLFHPSIEWFSLSVVPDQATIAVFKNDDPMPAFGDGTSCNPDAPSEGGWVYDSAHRGVSLVGDCTAFPGDTVRIEYESAGPLLIM